LPRFFDGFALIVLTSGHSAFAIGLKTTGITMQDSFETTSKGTTPDTPVSARRRLVSSALSVPVALTLRSGSAAAASVSCVLKQVQAPVSQANSAADDGWVRVQRWKLSGQNSNFSCTWISGAEVGNLAKTGKSVFLSGTEWWCLSAGSNAKIQTGGNTTNVLAGHKYSPSPSPPQYTGGNTLYKAVPESPAVWVSVRVDATGNIVGVVGDGQVATDSSSISDSCWSSFAG